MPLSAASDMGQSRRFDCVPPTSALPPSTDIVRSARQVRFVPNPEVGGGCCYPARFVHSHQTFFSGGIFHDPLMIDGFFSFGQYSLIIRMKSP